MKICVVAQEYPSANRPDAMAFTHARNVLYQKAGHEVSVLNFSTKAQYRWESVDVFPESAFDKKSISDFDVFVFHSPNLRNHLRFMLRFGSAIKNSVLVSHGFEFIDWHQQNSRLFDFQLSLLRRLSLFIAQIYDVLKIKSWGAFFRAQNGGGPVLVFVSNWLREISENCLGMDLKKHIRGVEIIHNPVHPVFKTRRFDALGPKKADFVSIRSFDDPKYAVDVVAEVARKNPQFSFHLYGDGKYFDYNSPPKNLTIFRQKFRQNDLPDVYNLYRAALLPTRWDSQGVMMCEVATFGMPTIVSDLPICRAMVGEFENVTFIENANPPVLSFPVGPVVREELLNKFGPANTVERELTLFQSLVSNQELGGIGRRSYGIAAALYIANSLFKCLSFVRGTPTGALKPEDSMLKKSFSPSGISAVKMEEANLPQADS